MGIEYEIDPHIVRGLDYYTRTVYEFIATDIGAQSTILGGGRYDGLIKDLGGPALSGIGFAAGITRLILAMEKSGVNIESENRPALYIASMGKGAAKYAMGVIAKLRNEGLYAETDLVGRSLKAQMKYADKKRAKFTLIIGDSELENNKAQLKNMDNSQQTEIALDDINALKSMLLAE
jgi:histidyl-tRNA synthetase